MPKSSEQSKPYSVEKALKEAAKMQKKIKSGKAKDYDEAERKIEVEKVLKTIAFYDDNQKFINKLKDALRKLNLEGLQNSALINLENKLAGGKRQEFRGVQMAQELLLQDDQKKILLYAFSSPEFIKTKKPTIELLLAKDNVKFTRLPFTAEDVVKILNEKGAKTQPEKADLIEIKEEEVTQKVRTILHGLKKTRSPEDTENENPDNLSRAVSEAKEYFPALESKTDKEVLEFLFATRKEIPEVMKGENIEGVYCDIEGTLFVEGKINKSVLQELKEYELQGKQVVLWTDGDINELQKLLDNEGIAYPLKNKIDFAGAQAEVVIDNDDQNTFFAKTKIFPKKFLKV